MSVAPNTQDRWLEIHQLMPALIDQGLVPANLTVPANSELHPYRPPRRRRRFLRLEKVGPAFWTITGLVSLVVNVVLIIVLISVAGQLFTLKSLVKDQLIGGLYENFVLMDQASIRTTIPVETKVPAKFDLPLETDTTVTLTDSVFIDNAFVSLDTGGLHISGRITASGSQRQYDGRDLSIWSGWG